MIFSGWDGFQFLYRKWHSILSASPTPQAVVIHNTGA